jgi:asparagine synthase (glutamine-hydrolysing)
LSTNLHLSRCCPSEAVRAADEPLADLAAVPLLAVSRLARQWVKVVLSGEGGDEILAGYKFDQVAKQYRIIKHLQMLPQSVLRQVSRCLAPFASRHADLLSRIASIPLSGWNLSLKNHMTKVWHQNEKTQLWPTILGLDSDRIIGSMYAAAKSEDPLDQILSVYQMSWLVEDLLMKADKMSMAVSLELRVPLLDYRIVEWANKQSNSLKVASTGPWRYATKYLLRRFAQKRLPREILARPKRGFPVPAYKWLQEDKMVRWATEHLTGRNSRLKSAFLPRSMKNQILLAAGGSFDAATKVWLLLVLETWLREYDAEIMDQADAPLYAVAAQG